MEFFDFTNSFYRSMQGIQYIVVGAFPPLYVIMKQRRNSPTNGNYLKLGLALLHVEIFLLGGRKNRLKHKKNVCKLLSKQVLVLMD